MYYCVVFVSLVIANTLNFFVCKSVWQKEQFQWRQKGFLIHLKPVLSLFIFRPLLSSYAMEEKLSSGFIPSRLFSYDLVFILYSFCYFFEVYPWSHFDRLVGPRLFFSP